MNRPLAVLSWAVAFYFCTGFVAKASFPPKADLLIGDAIFIGLTLFFLFLPFFNKIKVGSWLSLEREVKEAKQDAAAAKEELREFKNEIRTTVSMVTTNTVNLTLAGAGELRRQGAKVAEKLDPRGRERAEEVEQELHAESDTSYALAKIRIDIERLLRLIVGKEMNVPVLSGSTPRFMPLTETFEILVQSDSSFAYLRDPMKKVLAVCNAAIHAQNVSADQANEALKLGAQIIAILNQHKNVKE